MSLTHIIILAVIQGMAELLPVSSSAHVIAAAKFLHLDPSSASFTWLLVMLHTGTMFAVIVYFWRAWKRTFFHSSDEFLRFATKIIIATLITGVIGYGLKTVIEKVFLDPGYTELASGPLLEAGKTPTTPTASTYLVNLVGAEKPGKPLFKIGDLLTLSGTKGGYDLPLHTLKVNSTTSLHELGTFFRNNLGITDAAPARSKAMPPGVTLKADAAFAGAVDLEIVGNEGSDSKIKLPSDAFVNQANASPLEFDDVNKGEVEQLFKRMDILAIALAAAGVLIFASGIYTATRAKTARKGITTADSIVIGAVQGICIPFRGFSRSGATISTGLFRGVARHRLEEFSFALAVVLTPAAIGVEALRLIKHQHGIRTQDFLPGLKGMGFSFAAGLVALAVLSKLLEKGQWWLFGVYCLLASGGAYWMHLHPNAIG